MERFVGKDPECASTGQDAIVGRIDNKDLNEEAPSKTQTGGRVDGKIDSSTK